jgi:hypothetical protein
MLTSGGIEILYSGLRSTEMSDGERFCKIEDRESNDNVPPPFRSACMTC